MEGLEIRQIRAAAKRLAGRVNRTPLLRSALLSEHLGAEIYLKLENLQLTGSFKVRGAMSRTLDRPEFRELAPFRFKPIAGGLEQTGNPDLVSASIQSYDARWEWFPSASDVIAVSAFYKDFTNPIESVQVSGAALTETFQNANNARNQGEHHMPYRNANYFMALVLVVLVIVLALRWFLLATYVYQIVNEGFKWLVGHKRPLRAERIAAFLELPLEIHDTGYGLLEERLVAMMGR